MRSVHFRLARNAFLALSLAVTGVATSARGDLLTNGDFNLDADVSGSPDGWFNWMYGPTAFAAYKNDAANDAFDFDGTNYVNAGNYGDWWSSGGGWFQVVSGAAGTAYTFSGFCSTEGWDNAAGELRVIYLDSGGTTIRQDVQHSADYQANLPWSFFSVSSVAPAGTAQVKVELATWGARGAVLWDSTSLNSAGIWKGTGSGAAADSLLWDGGAPSGADASAKFGSSIAADSTIAVDAPLTLGSVIFDNTYKYVVAGTSTLTLETSAGNAFVQVVTGTHRINVSTTLASDTFFSVAGGATLEVGDPLTIAAGKSLKTYGTGAVNYQSSITLGAGAKIAFAANAHPTALNLGSGATATVVAHGTGSQLTLTADALSIASDAKLDIADNVLILNVGGATARDQIRGLLASAYNGGAWTGGGITSSALSAGYALGYADSGTDVTVKITRIGDATLNGAVDFDDLLALAQNYNTPSGATWSQGDFTYDGVVNFDDLLPLAQNYGQGPATLVGLPADFAADWALAQSLVPEPATLSLLGVAGLGFTRRRRA